MAAHGEPTAVTVQGGAVDTRTRADILAELASLTHRAGRLTVVAPTYADLHGEIDALLEELDRVDA